MVELMVTVVILAFIMIAFFTIFKGGTSAWHKGDIRVELVQNGRIALDRMVSEIRQALPPDKDALPEIKGIRVCSGSDTNEVTKGNAGDRVLFEAALDGEEGAEEIRFSLLNSSDETTNTLYKRANNPVDTDEDGIPDSYPTPPPGAHYQVTAGMGEEGIVENLSFYECKTPAGDPTRPGLVTIFLALKDERFVDRIVLTATVKVPYCYGKEIAGGGGG